LDTANHRVKDSVIKAEWDLADGMGWRASASLPPVAVAKWNASGFDTVKLRVMDADSNVAIIAKVIKVANSGSALRLTSGPTDTTITPSDTISFTLYARDTSGVVKVIWNYGDGKFDTTKTGSVHAAKHAYPGPSVVAAGKDSAFALTVTVIDSLGGSTTQKLSNVKVANVVLTGTVTGATSGLVNTLYPFAVSVVPAGKKIAHAEWDLGDGQGWRAGSATGYSAKWLKPGVDTVKVRLTDKDSNTVVLKAAAITITNTKSTLTIGSIVDPFLATPGTRDTVVTPGDTVTFTLNAADVDGIKSLLWNFGDGSPIATTSTGSTKHGYPGVGVVPVNTAKRCTLSVRVVDTLGDTTHFNRVAVIKDTNDVPQIVSLPDTISHTDSLLQLSVVAHDLGKKLTFEWSVDGINFALGKNDTSLRMPSISPANFMIMIRAIDANGNVSKIDSVRISLVSEITDSRDQQLYRIVTIGSQTWMAENLNYASSDSWWHENSPDSGRKYGRFYAWNAALALPATCTPTSCSNQIIKDIQGACPVGWHIPTLLEWNTLSEYAWPGRQKDAILLKSTAGWNQSGNGVDKFRFNALPAGFESASGVSNDIGNSARWWTASADLTYGNAWGYRFDYNVGNSWSYAPMGAISVRCMKD
jgi:uncharacterized protein (TIGR02145 family)